MKSFNEYLEEGRVDLVKGWTLKRKIVSVTTDYSNYHIMQVTNKPRKFGLDEKKLLKILEDWYEDMSAPDHEREARIMLSKLQDGGEVDNSPPIEEYLFKKGYCRFVIDKTHGSVEGQTENECREGAKALDNDYLPYERDGFKLFEIKPIKGRPKYITNKFDFNDFVDGKAKRKHVSKMAQFREASDSYPASYEKNAQLNKLVDKHDDPLKFVLDVITQMSKGRLKLRRIGVANTREVVAFWNSKKKRQIKPSYVMEQLEMLGELNDVDEGEKLEALWQKFLKKIKMRPFDRKERARTKEQRKAILKWNKLMGIGASYDVTVKEYIDWEKEN